MAVTAVIASTSALSSSAATTDPSVLVPIRPCRLIDTRPAPDNVGPRATPLHADDVFTVDVWGANGNCTLPSGITGVSLNVTVENPTAASYLTAFPADAARPLAANLNWIAHQAPTPNAVTAALSASGKLSFYNLAGDVDLTVDVVGYYEHAVAEPGPVGPAGPKGPTGDVGLAGAPGLPAPPSPSAVRDVWVATSGGDFTSVGAALASITDNDWSHHYVVHVAPGVWDVGGGLTLKDEVDLVGSGQGVTILTGSAATIVHGSGNDHSVLRDLTVRSTFTDTNPHIGIDIDDAPSGGGGTLRITDVTVEVMGTSTVLSASAHGLRVVDGSLEIDHVTIRAHGASAFGLDVTGATAAPGVDHLVVDAVSTSQGNPSAVAYGVHDDGGSFGGYVDVRATAVSDGGKQAFAVYVNDNPHALLRQVQASARGATTNVGIFLLRSDLGPVGGAHGAASGGATAAGIWLDESFVQLSGADAEGTDASAESVGLKLTSSSGGAFGGTVANAVLRGASQHGDAFGVHLSAGPTFTIRSSSVAGPTPLRVEAGSHAYIVNNTVVGGASSFDAFTGTCLDVAVGNGAIVTC